MLKKGRIEQLDRRSSGWVQKGCNLTAERMQIGCKKAAKRMQIGCKNTGARPVSKVSDQVETSTTHQTSWVSAL